MSSIARPLATALFVAALCASLGLAGCGSSSACIATNGDIDQCRQDLDEAECERLDEQSADGSSWNYQPDKACAEAGYEHECGDGTWARDAAGC